MNNISSKKIAIIIIVISFLAFTVPISLIMINTNNEKAEIIVIYDENSDTTIKSRNLIITLMTSLEIDLDMESVSEKEDVYSQILKIDENVDAIILIGHGSLNGFHVGDDLIPWSNLSELILSSKLQDALFLSCYSSLISLNETESMKQKYITFQSKIDYIVACYAGALLLSHNLSLEDTEDKIYDDAIDNLETIIDHALGCFEVLWWGSTHLNMASYALDLGITYGLLNILSNLTQDYMVKANAADIVDQVSSLESGWAGFKTIITDPVRRALWLKHNYGTRGGITIQVFWIPVYTIPVYGGTAPDAAQNAYDAALNAYREKDYVEAGKQLSYAVHYGQDMTMPYHVYDYLKILLNILNPLNLYSALISIAAIYDDYGGYQMHNLMEEWVHNEWNNNLNFMRAVLSEVENINVNIEDGTYSIFNCVDNLAKFTRSHIPEHRMEYIFKGTDETKKREALIPLLARGIAFSIAIYKKFIDDTCNPPEKPKRPVGPDLSYINYSNPFRFESIDPDGDDIKYQIDWGDGTLEMTEFVKSGSKIELEHCFNIIGNYEVKVRAVDFHNNQHTLLWSNWSEPKLITIENTGEPPPEPSKPSIGGPTTVYIDNYASFSAISFDSDGNYLIYEFDFGDGYKWYSDLTQSGVRIYHSHIYTSLGVKTLTVNVQNTRGGENRNTLTINVIEEPSDVPPSKPDPPNGPVEGYIDTEYEFTVSYTHVEGKSIKFEIDWGDGQISITQYYSSGSTINLSHIWDVEDIYKIKLRVQEEGGLWSSWSDAHNLIIYDPDGPVIIP
jgi:hypothetical protein